MYCEWPLGNGLAEAQALAALARKKGVLAVVGLQARAAPKAALGDRVSRQHQLGRGAKVFGQQGASTFSVAR